METEKKMERYLQGISVQKIEETQESLTMRIENVDVSAVNALRRTVISDCPSMAIEWVYIKENTSAMPDEIFSHRLGLIPIETNPDAFAEIERPPEYNPEEITNEGNSIKLELTIKNTSAKTISVYSDNIKFTLNTKNAKIKPGILITKLGPGEEIECKMIAVKGIGRVHAKWMPVSICYYRFLKRVEIKSPEMIPKIEKYFTSGLIKDPVPYVDENTLRMNTDVLKDYPDAITVSTADASFIFEIETISENPKNILLRSLSVLQQKLSLLKKEAFMENTTTK